MTYLQVDILHVVSKFFEKKQKPMKKTMEKTQPSDPDPARIHSTAPSSWLCNFGVGQP